MILKIPKLNFLFIFLLIITLIGGSYMVVCHIGGVEFSAYRLVLGLSMIYLLVSGQLKCYTNRFSKYVFFVLLIWFFYGLTSLLWTPELIYGIQELFYLGVGLSSYLVFFSFANARTDFDDSLEKVWIASFVAVVVFLIIEMITQRHLEGEFLQKLSSVGDFHGINLIPLFTFVNQNILGIYFCVSIVFSAYFLFKNRNKVMNGIIILVAVDFLLLTQSRLGVMCIITLVILSLSLFLFKDVRKKNSLSFSRKQLGILLLFIALNTCIMRLEHNFLNLGSDFRSYQDEGIESIHSKIRQKTNEKMQISDRILLMSDSKLQAESENDMIFAIEGHAHLKLLEGDTVNLTLKSLSPKLQRAVFMGGSQLLIILFAFLIVCLIVAYLIAYRSNQLNIVLLLASGGLFLIPLLPANAFRYSSDGYRSSALVETDLNTANLELKDLQVISVSSATGSLLKKNKEAKTFLYSKSMEAGPGKTMLPEQLSSNTIRKNLVLNGLDYLKSSCYMGLGSGGFLASNLKKLNKYPDGGVGGAHNFIIEILSQYGVVIFSLLTSVFVWIGWILLQALRTKRWSKTHFLLLWLLVSLVFMGNANSLFLSLPINWMLVAFVLIVANRLIETKKCDGEKELGWKNQAEDLK